MTLKQYHPPLFVITFDIKRNYFLNYRTSIIDPLCMLKMSDIIVFMIFNIRDTRLLNYCVSIKKIYIINTMILTVSVQRPFSPIYNTNFSNFNLTNYFIIILIIYFYRPDRSLLLQCFTLDIFQKKAINLFLFW